MTAKEQIEKAQAFLIAKGVAIAPRKPRKAAPLRFTVKPVSYSLTLQRAIWQMLHSNQLVDYPNLIPQAIELGIPADCLP